MSSGPPICVLLANWWGGTWENFAFLKDLSNASNIFVGGNPAYGIADFLSVYPKFGTISTGLDTQRYYPVETPDGIITVFHFGGQATSADAIQVFLNGLLQTEGVDYTLVLNAQISTVTFTTAPAVGTKVATYFPTASGVYVGVIPQIVLQMYINLANACLQFCRWQDNWLMGMALFIAHYATLYLRSEGGYTSNTPVQQLASSGLALGLATSKAAGDVSLGYEYLTGDWAGWGAWNLTLYGEQLMTMAKIIGMGPMYIW